MLKMLQFYPLLIKHAEHAAVNNDERHTETQTQAKIKDLTLKKTIKNMSSSHSIISIIHLYKGFIG